MSIPTLCLSMIVKNESSIILRLLESVYDLLDSYVLCDTGSDDNTIELVTNFFKKKGIPGKIVEEPFRDFGYNRSFALSACIDINNADYILLLDADMIIIRNMAVSPSEFKRNLIGGDVFYVLQGNDVFNYQNTRIVKNRIGCTYVGVTHEYVSFPDKMVLKTIAKKDFFIHDLGDGSNKSDKAERDIRLLTQGLIDKPNNDRYTFYLANSYRDIKNYDKAIELYEKRIEIGGWLEEIWYSHYIIGKLYQEQNKPDKAIFHWLEAYNVFPNRIENLYNLVKYYREKGNNHLAYNFFCLADYERNKTTEWDFLFTENDIYDFKLDYELTIIGYYSNEKKFDLKNACMKVLTNINLDDGSCRNVLSNYKFYSDSIIDSSIALLDCNRNILSNIGIDIGPEFNSSTPSICFGETINELLICVRFVNYHISENGDYINKKNITTKNVVATINISSNKWIKKSENILEYNTKIDDYYIGQEDVRIFRREDLINNKVIHSYTCNRMNQENQIKVEYGNINVTDISSINSKFLIKNGERECEKNWCLFEQNGQEKCVYGWSPLIIGDINNNSFIETHNFTKVPGFFRYVRGSSNGITIGDEIWLLCHTVSYEDRRFYYHLVIVLDKNTLTLKKFTKLFTFEKQKVEYTLGFLYFKAQNRFLIGYSLMDKETKYSYTSKHIFDGMMIT